MEKTELSKAEWLSKAERYCARAEHCAADVRRKLYEWGAPADLSGFIEENLYAGGYLDDARFCQSYVHDKVEYQSWGRLKIRAGLQALQLPDRDNRLFPQPQGTHPFPHVRSRGQTTPLPPPTGFYA